MHRAAGRGGGLGVHPLRHDRGHGVRLCGHRQAVQRTRNLHRRPGPGAAVRRQRPAEDVGVTARRRGQLHRPQRQPHRHRERNAHRSGFRSGDAERQRQLELRTLAAGWGRVSAV